MKKKYIVILIPILIVIIGLILILKPKKQTINNMELSNEDIEEVNYIYKAIENRELESGWEYMERYQGPMIKGILENRVDVWNDKVFTKDFLKKYKNGYWDNSDIILIDSPQGEYRSRFCFSEEKKSEKNMYITKKDGFYIYLFSLEFSDDFKIKDLIKINEIKVLDKNGEYLEERKIILDNKNFGGCIAAISFPSFFSQFGDEPTKYGRMAHKLSNNFLSKYSYDKDVVDCNFEIDDIELLQNESDFENKTVILILYYENFEKNKKIKLNYYMNDKGLLDDIKYTFLN